jgi:phage-related holin
LFSNFLVASVKTLTSDGQLEKGFTGGLLGGLFAYCASISIEKVIPIVLILFGFDLIEKLLLALWVNRKKGIHAIIDGLENVLKTDFWPAIGSLITLGIIILFCYGTSFVPVAAPIGNVIVYISIFFYGTLEIISILKHTSKIFGNPVPNIQDRLEELTNSELYKKKEEETTDK